MWIQRPIPPFLMGVQKIFLPVRMTYTITVQHGPAPQGAMNWRSFQDLGTGITVHIDVSDLTEEFDVNRTLGAPEKTDRRYDILLRAQKLLSVCPVVLYTHLGVSYTCAHIPGTAVSECFCSDAFGIQCPA